MTVATGVPASQDRTSSRLMRSARSELLSTRSTATAYVLLVGSAGMAIASCLANLAAIPDEDLASAATIERAMHASTVATLIFAVVAGVVSSTSDYRFGRIDQTLLSEPRRLTFYAAKVGVGGLLGITYGLVGAVAAIAAIGSYFAIKGQSVDLASSPVVLPLLGVVVAAALLAMVGTAVGTAVRNQPAALAGSLAWLLILEPTALLGLPLLGKWLPGAAGIAMTRSPDPELLTQFGGGLVLFAWAIVTLAVGGLRLRSAAV